MCGICGVVRIGGGPGPTVAPAVLDAMTDSMVHRGPDDRGTYAADGVALGVRRLSIVDVERGHQPFSNEDGSIWAIQNGELYNHLEIRRDLTRDGHVFHTGCDTEILPHLYEDDRGRFEQRLRGMFGLAVWDGSRRRLVLARDRLGIKPLYYAIVGDRLVFGSELKAVAASGLVGFELDPVALDAYLALGFVPAPRTPFRQIRKLPPGHRLVTSPEGVAIEPFWEFPKPAPAGDQDDLGERLLHELEHSVRLRLMADVPLGAMLSGGLDSSLIVALMARNMGSPVKTFSIGFTDEGTESELDDARFVAQLFGTEHHEIELSLVDDAVDLPTLTWHMDEPLADLSALGFFALSELTARHVKVALSGQGADELLGGYSRHRNARIIEHWDLLPTAIRRPTLPLLSGLGARGRRAAEVFGKPTAAERLLEMKRHIGADRLRRLSRGVLEGNAAVELFSQTLNGFDRDLVAAALYVDGRTSLADDMLHYFDRMSMAHSLEVRVPFLDHHVVELCSMIASSRKVRGSTTKFELKRVARRLLPARIVDKRKIGFFNPAVAGWFRAQMAGAVPTYLLTDNPCYAELLDPREVRSLVDRHVSGRSAHGDELLTILMLEVWLSTYVPRVQALARAAPAAARA